MGLLLEPHPHGYFHLIHCVFFYLLWFMQKTQRHSSLLQVVWLSLYLLCDSVLLRIHVQPLQTLFTSLVGIIILLFLAPTVIPSLLHQGYITWLLVFAKPLSTKLTYSKWLWKRSSADTPALEDRSLVPHFIHYSEL